MKKINLVRFDIGTQILKAARIQIVGVDDFAFLSGRQSKRADTTHHIAWIILGTKRDQAKEKRIRSSM